jgi:hypothetical protein
VLTGIDLEKKRGRIFHHFRDSLCADNQVPGEGSRMEKKRDRSTWVIGGTTLIGVGVGFIFLETSALLFVASIMIGIGAGLVLAPLLKGDKGN